MAGIKRNTIAKQYPQAQIKPERGDIRQGAKQDKGTELKESAPTAQSTAYKDLQDFMPEGKQGLR